MESRLVVGLPSVLSAVIVLVGTLALACDNKQPDNATPPATSQAATSASAPAPQVRASAPTPPDTTSANAIAPTGSGTPADSAATAKASPDGKKDGGGASPTASGAPAECGTKPQPDCPLQAWMKANVNPPVTSNDTAALATALDKIVAFAPAGYTNWGSIAKDGANAARANDMAAAKASCRTCHDQYKTKYKTEMRARKI